MKAANKTTLLHQKISLIFFGLFLTIVILEIGLRIGGFTILSMQEHRNLQSIKQEGSFRIMCLGESTTQGQYPAYLEEILNKRNIGVKFSVIDKGLAGTNTTRILCSLEDDVNKYKPHMIISMIGINDFWADIPCGIDSCSLKICRFIKFLWLCTASKFKKERLKDKNKNLSVFQKARLFKKALKSNPYDYSAYEELGWIYLRQGKFSESERVFKQALKFNPENDRLTRMLATAYFTMGNYSLAYEYVHIANKLGNEYYNPVVIDNYHSIKHILDKKKIKLICAQYPNRDIEPLKKMFKEEMEGSIVFVDNEKIFKDAVRKEGYKEYFRDMFGGDFGHCTQKGNKLLAENIADVILKEYFNK